MYQQDLNETSLLKSWDFLCPMVINKIIPHNIYFAAVKDPPTMAEE